MRKQILVTGGVGFIGYHVSKKLAELGHEVVIVDILSSYYDRNLKMRRMTDLMQNGNGRIKFFYGDITKTDYLKRLIGESNIGSVIHLAAQPGVGVSMTDPSTTYMANVIGTASVLQACAEHQIDHILYASSSSVYGNCREPAKESQALNPLNHYAVSKVTTEMMAEQHWQHYGGSMTGMRFFTVYGPWGRPDMAYWKFTQAIEEGLPITLRGTGITRDMTYCDDVVEMILGVFGRREYRHDIVNMGSERHLEVREIITSAQTHMGKTTTVVGAPYPTTEARHTQSCNAKLQSIIGNTPITPFHEGMGKFVEWYKKENK